MPFDEELADRVRSILARHPGFSEYKMFGGLCFMIRGRMCCGVVKTDLMIRLSPEKAKAALRKPHARPMDFTGKPMKSMIYVDWDGTVRDQDLTGWVESALSFVRTLPPNE